MNQAEYLVQIGNSLLAVPAANQKMFMGCFATQAKNPVVAFGLSVFGGSFGLDRFYIGDIGLGIAKLLTFGGFGLWSLVDLFLIASATRQKNVALAILLQGTYS